jgi:hypothetical protein
MLYQTQLTTTRRIVISRSENGMLLHAMHKAGHDDQGVAMPCVFGIR